jgi:ABC-type multidrug transport system ATPase subunit
MAIVHDPRLLILDEPTSGLDPEERESMLHRIRILTRDFRKSVILWTHILPDVQTICDQVVILAAGAVRVSNTLESLCRMFHVFSDVAGWILDKRLAVAGIATRLAMLGTLTANSIAVLCRRVSAPMQI